MTEDQIYRHSKLPLYHQLHEILRGGIMRGDWLPGEMLPPESQLIEQYQISRTTVRQVFDMLVNEGLVYRQRGRGTFVSQPTIEQSQVRIVSFTEDMRQRGLEPGTQVLEAGLLPAPNDIARILGVPAGSELAHIQRLRLANDEPLSMEDAYLVHRYCPGILQRDYASDSLRRTLEQFYGVRLERATQVTRAVPASNSLSEHLGVNPGSATLFLERVSYDLEQQPVEFLRIYYRGDRYSLYSELLG
ncbi:MAG: GntR family transcriptional regulator [Chloroflexota bacterium]|nr:GntR family transcriptional regulator [Chloroflexota bacterium]